MVLLVLLRELTPNFACRGVSPAQRLKKNPLFRELFPKLRARRAAGALAESDAPACIFPPRPVGCGGAASTAAACRSKAARCRCTYEQPGGALEAHGRTAQGAAAGCGPAGLRAQGRARRPATQRGCSCRHHSFAIQRGCCSCRCSVRSSGAVCQLWHGRAYQHRPERPCLPAHRDRGLQVVRRVPDAGEESRPRDRGRAARQCR